MHTGNGDEERTATLEEIFENAYQELRRNLANELLAQIVKTLATEIAERSTCNS
jgi:restriction endonuclease Mrr